MKRHPDSVTIELCNSEAESGVFIDVCVRRSVCVWGGVCVHFCSSLLCISCWVVELVDHCRGPRVSIHSPATYLRVCVCVWVCVLDLKPKPRLEAPILMWGVRKNPLIDLCSLILSALTGDTRMVIIWAVNCLFSAVKTLLLPLTLPPPFLF